MGTGHVGRVLLVAGVAVAAVGLLLIVGGALGLGHLPGDVAVRRGNLHLYAPLATCVVLSVVATLVLRLVSRR